MLGVYPNPFRDAATIRLAMDEGQYVDVAVFDALGRQVETLYRGTLPAGEHHVRWQPSGGQSAGLYFYRVRAGRSILGGTMVYRP